MLPLMLFNVLSSLVVDKATDLAQEHVEDMIEEKYNNYSDMVKVKNNKEDLSKQDVPQKIVSSYLQEKEMIQVQQIQKCMIYVVRELYIVKNLMIIVPSLLVL